MTHRLGIGLGKGVVAAVAAMAMMWGFTGMPEAEANHCGPVFVFSGHHAGTTFGPATNPGAGGCVLRDENVNTNYLVPGATFVSVGTTLTPPGAPASPVPVGTVVEAGDLVVDDRAPVPLTLTWSGTRWNSQRVALDGGTVVTASVPSVTGVTVTNTYRAVTEEVPA